MRKFTNRSIWILNSVDKKTNIKLLDSIAEIVYKDNIFVFGIYKGRGFKEAYTDMKTVEEILPTSNRYKTIMYNKYGIEYKDIMENLTKLILNER